VISRDIKTLHVKIMESVSERKVRIILVTRVHIRNLRKAAGFTQRELAERAGVSQSLIARIEAGTVDPRLSTVRRILESLNSSLTAKVAKDVMHSPVMTVGAKDTIRKVVDIMKRTGFSQLPVMMNGKVVGSIQEATLLDRIASSGRLGEALDETVYNIMDAPFPTVGSGTDVRDISRLLSSHWPAVLVTEDGSILGIITKIDIISFGIGC